MGNKFCSNCDNICPYNKNIETNLSKEQISNEVPEDDIILSIQSSQKNNIDNNEIDKRLNEIIILNKVRKIIKAYKKHLNSINLTERENFSNSNKKNYMNETINDSQNNTIFESKLKDNNIELSFFMSAYFITLYTILYPNLPENDISFILHLWDDFILDGWSSFFSNWLTILKYHEKDIMKIKEDRLINFLTNQIKESDLYKKENYPKFLELKKKFKINEELIKNLQDEIAVEVGIRKIGASTIIEDFNADDKAAPIK